MQMSILLDNYALLNVRRVETSLLDDLALLWNKLLDWLILQTIYNRLYDIQLRSLYSNCYGSYSFICGHCCWLILWVWISGLKFSLPHICVVSYLQQQMWLDTSGIWFNLFTWLMVLMVYFSVLVFLSGSIKDHFGFTPRKHLQGNCIFFTCRLYAKGFQGKDQGIQKNGFFVEANNLIWVLPRNPSSRSEHWKEGSPLVGNTKFRWYQLFIYGIILLDQCFLFANNQYVYRIMKFLDPTAEFHMWILSACYVSADSSLASTENGRPFGMFLGLRFWSD